MQNIPIKYIVPPNIIPSIWSTVASIHTPPAAGDHQRVVFCISDCEAGSDLFVFCLFSRTKACVSTFKWKVLQNVRRGRTPGVRYGGFWRASSGSTRFSINSQYSGPDHTTASCRTCTQIRTQDICYLLSWAHSSLTVQKFSIFCAECLPFFRIFYNMWNILHYVEYSAWVRIFRIQAEYSV